MQTTHHGQNEMPNNIATFRHDGDFYFTYGVKAFKRKDFEKAEKWFNKALEIEPDNTLYLCQMSVLYTEVHQYHRSNDLLQQVLNSNQPYVDTYYLLANNYAHLGLFYEAKKNAEKYLEEDPEGDFVKETNELLKLLEQVMVEQAEDDGIEFDEEDELMLYQETAFYHLEHEEWAEALQTLEEMTVYYPEYLPAKHEYAYALFQLGHDEEAVALEEAWLKQDELSLNSRMNLTYFSYHMGNKEEFEAYLNQLLNIYPTYNEKKLKLAVTLAQVDAYNEAIERFKKLNKEQMTNYVSYYLWYGYALNCINKTKQASFLWEEAKEHHPSFDKLLKTHGWV
ncbi:tetratricopeptide (TPR) repeat protein [Alkalibacillus filiformis]|uniref:Tetratricopeptide (TPR) repeat protein n=1 Tax=Alkalibacillus filiformis TaxID=200990 RepID=A0ABU0DVP3_9BACI|nr:tetratricopeptide repeat protein [Alkalibacillus filiformis]MDQ0352538.1 tetratricopeptide (TPR) repeat protein [Alkalibacillus filiformis]